MASLELASVARWLCVCTEYGVSVSVLGISYPYVVGAFG